VDHVGYSWTVRADGDQWSWALLPRGGGAAIIVGTAPSRAVAAAMVIRAIARGMTEQPTVAESLAA